VIPPLILHGRKRVTKQGFFQSLREFYPPLSSFSRFLTSRPVGLSTSRRQATAFFFMPSERVFFSTSFPPWLYGWQLARLRFKGILPSPPVATSPTFVVPDFFRQSDRPQVGWRRGQTEESASSGPPSLYFFCPPQVSSAPQHGALAPTLASDFPSFLPSCPSVIFFFKESSVSGQYLCRS